MLTSADGAACHSAAATAAGSSAVPCEAAVCVLTAPRDAAWIQLVAREMNLSETAFLVRRAAGDGFDLRWFTPLIEVPLCGHATLASAHVLWEDGHLPAGAQARFHTRSGLLTADRLGGWIELDFPADPAFPAEAPPELLRAIGPPVVNTGRASNRYLVELADEHSVRNLSPDLATIIAIPVQGVIVTSRATTPPYDFVSRYFAPRAGVPEDPVKGSAHCSLTPYWAARLGKTEFLAGQADARGGVLRVRLTGDRVRIAGQARTVLRGELLAE